MMLIADPIEFMIQIAESVKLHKFKKEFEFTIRPNRHVNSYGVKTHTVYSVVVYDDLGTLIIEDWSTPIDTLFNSIANDFINKLPGDDLIDLANLIVENPQQFLDELTIFMVHAA